MAKVNPSGGGSAEQIALQLASNGAGFNQISVSTGWSPQQVASFLNANGYTVKQNYPSVAGIPVQGSYSSPSYTYSKNAPAAGTTLRQDNPAKPNTSSSASGSGKGLNLGNIFGGGGTTSNITGNPNAQPSSQSPIFYDSGAGAAAASAAADRAERKREFDVTTARDIAKQNATEVDALQQRLAGLSGPKDVYADYFFSHGLLPPQGYKPAPVPLTQAQTDAYGKMGTTPQQLQTMLGGSGQPGANQGMLGNLGNSLQTPAGLPQFQTTQAPPIAQGPSNPTMPGGALYGKTPPGGSNIPTTPGGVPSMAVGGQVPGPPGTPKLAVVHGGEEVTPAPQSGAPSQSVTAQQPPAMPTQNGGGAMMMSQPGLHPAISALVDAVSNLLSSPDFRPFVQATQQTNQATQGGVPSMALGGTIPLGAQTGGQGLLPNTPPQPDNPVMPIENMDPYTRALYDVHGRLHPYSAQQELQMGPQGIDAVSSYVSKVQGGDIKAYQGLVDRLRPSGAPQMGDVQNEGFLTG